MRDGATVFVHEGNDELSVTFAAIEQRPDGVWVHFEIADMPHLGLFNANGPGKGDPENRATVYSSYANNVAN